MRKVYIKHPQHGLQEFDVKASTFGELKSELGSKMNFNGYRVVLKQGMHDLNEDSAGLPPEDFALYCYPMKNKAGN